MRLQRKEQREISINRPKKTMRFILSTKIMGPKTFTENINSWNLSTKSYPQKFNAHESKLFNTNLSTLLIIQNEKAKVRV